jgi:hypothetical protein
MPLNHDSSSAQPVRKPALSDEERRAQQRKANLKWYKAHPERAKENSRR